MADLAASVRGLAPPIALVIAPDLSGAAEGLDVAAAATGRPVVRVVALAAEAASPLAALRSIERSLAPGDVVVAREVLVAAHAGSVLVVDDAHWLDEESLTVLSGLAARAKDHDVGLLVAHRPSHAPGLAAFDEALAGAGPIARVDGLTAEEVATRVASRTGRATTDGTVERMVELTGGRLGLVDLVIDGGQGTVPDDGPGVTAASDAVVGALRLRVARLPEAARDLLLVLSLAPVAPDDLVAAVTGLDQATLVATRSMLRDAGLLVPDSDAVIPLVVAAVMFLTEPEVRRDLERRVGQELADRHGSVRAAAQHLAAAGASGPAAVAQYRAAAEECAAVDPAAAASWYEQALTAGGDPLEQLAVHAEVVARVGDLDAAMGLAGRALAEVEARHRGTAARVAGVVAFRRGQTDLALEYFLEASTFGEPSARQVLDPVLAGRGRPRLDSVDDPEDAWADRAAVALAEAARAAVEVDPSSPMGFLEAASLCRSGSLAVLLADAPHVLGAVAASVAGDLPVARDLLARAGADDRAGTYRTSVAAWSAWMGGGEAPAGGGEDLPGRDGLVAAATAARAARRSGDLAALHDAWQRAEPFLIVVAPDLWLLEPAAELAAVSSRLDPHERAERWLDELDAMVEAGGAAPAWRVALAWARLQVAVAADDVEAVASGAARLQSLDDRVLGPGARALVAAAAVWRDVVAGEIEPPEVERAAGTLAAVGRPWEASRLVGQAAVRTTDPALARSLLVRARELSGSAGGAGAPASPEGTRPGVLSEREIEVSRLVLEGRTHKEIGAQLYLSPKTVEHHVARIRTKLGVSTRAEMIAALHRELQ